MMQENLYSEFGGAVSALPGETVAVLTAAAEASTSRGEAGDGSAATGGAQLQARYSVPVFLRSTG